MKQPMRFGAALVLTVLCGGCSLVSGHKQREAAAQPESNQGSVPYLVAINEKIYVVKDGDTLDSVAKATGVSADTLKQLNPGLKDGKLKAGVRLRLQ
jgi:LysM repeat protein